MNNKDFAKNIDDLSPYEVFEYATYLPPRTSEHGKFRRHKTLGHAKAALANTNIYWDTTKMSDVPMIYRWYGGTGAWAPLMAFNPKTREFTLVV